MRVSRRYAAPPRLFFVTRHSSHCSLTNRIPGKSCRRKLYSTFLVFSTSSEGTIVVGCKARLKSLRHHLSCSRQSQASCRFDLHETRLNRLEVSESHEAKLHRLNRSLERNRDYTCGSLFQAQ